MAVDTFVYVKCETANLAATYGGDAIVADAGSFATTPVDFTHRRLLDLSGRPTSKTRFLGRSGTANGSEVWTRFTQAVYDDLAALSAFMSSETTSATTSAPTGWTLNSNQPIFNPDPAKINLYAWGDSITEGVGGTDGQNTAWLGQLLPLLDSSTITQTNSGRTRIGSAWAGINMGQGSSSWDNALIGGGNPADYATYGKRFSLTFTQRFSTLPLNNVAKMWINVFFGTNDLFYAKDAGVQLTAATIWQREVDQVARIRTRFPNAYISTCTSIRREENATYNNIVRAKNDLQKSNYVAAGIDRVIDLELQAHPDFNTQTGDTTASSSSYTGAGGVGTPDNTHPNDFGYLQIANYMKTQADEIKALKGW